jgi:hypothetical protein
MINRYTWVIPNGRKLSATPEEGGWPFNEVRQFPEQQCD